MNPIIMNQSADYWHYKIGVNVIKANTKVKETYENWSQWQDQSIPDHLHEERKQNGYYSDGLAIIPGKIWRGPYIGKYLVAIDLDNRKAIEEFCRNNLERLKQTTLVEQTSNPDKMHIYFIVEREIPNKASDKTNIATLAKINANEIPALEVKSKSNGIMFCADSPHENGSNYHIIGTLKPQEFEAWGIEEQISILCDKYNIPYGSNNITNNNNNYSEIGPSIQELFTPGTKILEGHNRHLGILRVMDSLLIKNMGYLTLEEIKEHAQKRNSGLCVPPLDDKEFEKQWKQSLDFAHKKIKEREEAKKKQQQQSQEQEQSQSNNNRTNNKNNQASASTTTNTKAEKQQLIEDGTRIIMSKHRFLTIEETKDILVYDEDKGVYVYGGEIIIEKELEEIFQFDLRSADIAEVKGHIQRKTFAKRLDFDANLDIVNLKNGLYNIRTGILEPHTPEYYSINQKCFSYNPKAKSKYFRKFLDDVLYPQDIETAIDIIAYTFLRSNPHELYFILIGVGANGKSVYTGLINNLHGLNNVSNVPLKALVENRFALADLENKDVNIDTELSSNSIKDMSILKKLTGRHPMRIERKGKQAYDTILHAKLIFNANQIPTNPDSSDAHYRREIILSFPNQFEGDKEDPELLNKLSTEEELSGIFNIIAEVLKTRIVKTQKVYVDTKTILERREKVELIRDPVAAFLKDAICEDPDWNETKIDVYEAYKRFCTFHKLPLQQYDTFGDILRKEHKFEKDRKTKDRKKETVWKNIRIVEWKDPDDPSQKTFTDGDGEQ
jgi:P4 family phage/plasmid primase-like protien